MMMMTTTMMMTKRHPAKNARFVATSLSFSALFTMVAGIEISNQVTRLAEEQNAKSLAEIQPSVTQISEAVSTNESPVFAEPVVLERSETTATTVAKKKKKATAQPSATSVVTVEAAPVASTPEPALTSAPVETVVTVEEVAPAADATSAAS